MGKAVDHREQTQNIFQKHFQFSSGVGGKFLFSETKAEEFKLKLPFFQEEKRNVKKTKD